MWVGYHLRDSGSETAGAVVALTIYLPITHHDRTPSLALDASAKVLLSISHICFELTSRPVLSFFSLSHTMVSWFLRLCGSDLALELVNLPHGQEKLKTCVWLFWFSIRKRIFPFSSLLEEETPNFFQCV